MVLPEYAYGALLKTRTLACTQPRSAFANRKVADATIDAAVRSAAKVLSIEPLLEAPPAPALGGAAQRVAL